MQKNTIDFFESIRRSLRVSIKKEENKIELSTKKGGGIIINLLLPEEEPKKRLIDYFRKTRRNKKTWLEITEEECKKMLLNKLTYIIVFKRRLLGKEEEIWEEIENEVWEEIRDDIMKTKRFFYVFSMPRTFGRSEKFFIIEPPKERV